MANKLAKKDGLILVLNSGSSSLKFGIYRPGETDEEPMLTGSAEGVGRDDGSLHIRSSDGTSLSQRECIHESQSDALNALAAAIREHIDNMPLAVGHRVVHGGPNLRRHQIITPQVLDELRSGRVELPPFRIEVESTETGSGDGRADAILRLRWGKRSYRFVAEP